MPENLHERQAGRHAHLGVARRGQTRHVDFDADLHARVLAQVRHDELRVGAAFGRELNLDTHVTCTQVLDADHARQLLGDNELTYLLDERRLLHTVGHRVDDQHRPFFAAGLELPLAAQLEAAAPGFVGVDDFIARRHQATGSGEVGALDDSQELAQ